MDTEMWRDVIGYEGSYRVSSFGRIQSCRTERILKQQESTYGYYQISLENDIHSETIGVHRLVAQAFVANPKELNIVHHKDGDKKNNLMSNLEWVTHQQNLKEYHTRAVHGSITDLQETWLKRLWLDGYSKQELSQIFAVTHEKITKILAAP